MEPRRDESTSAYDRLGEAGLRDLIADFYARVRGDHQLGPFFATTDLAHLISMQHEYVAIALGGPVTRTGRDLRETHAGRGIGEHDLARFLQLMTDACEHAGLQPHEIDLVVQRMAVASSNILDSTTETG